MLLYHKRLPVTYVRASSNAGKWLKSKNISDQEMLKTFNCGVGFCLIVDKKNVKMIQKYFSKDYKPYEIGNISINSNKLNLYNSLIW